MTEYRLNYGNGQIGFQGSLANVRKAYKAQKEYDIRHKQPYGGYLRIERYIGEGEWETMKLQQNPAKTGWPATYTTAPADYDWFGTHTEAVVGTDKRGREIRKVRSDPRHFQSQRDRYYSGGIYMVADETEWKKLVKYNLVTLKANPFGWGWTAVFG